MQSNISGLIKDPALVVFFLLSAGLVLTGLVLLLRFQDPVKLEIISAADKQATASASNNIWVDVGGAVATPGVFELTEGSRVKDALVAAGGLNENADRETINRTVNLAAPLKDGTKLYFAAISGAVAESTPSTPGLVNLNSAPVSELEQLSGIGPSRASAIVAGRPYQTTEELVSKKIISESVYLKIADRLTVF